MYRTHKPHMQSAEPLMPQTKRGHTHIANTHTHDSHMQNAEAPMPPTKGGRQSPGFAKLPQDSLHVCGFFSTCSLGLIRTEAIAVAWRTAHGTLRTIHWFQRVCECDVSFRHVILDFHQNRSCCVIAWRPAHGTQRTIHGFQSVCVCVCVMSLL